MLVGKKTEGDSGDLFEGSIPEFTLRDMGRLQGSGKLAEI
jgi:hypothetical protein